MKLGKNTIVSVAYIALFSVLGLLVNNFVFLHYHKLDNGSYVIHAHPYSNSTDSSGEQTKHTHTSHEFKFFNFINSIFAFAILLGCISFFLSFFLKKIKTNSLVHYRQSFLSQLKARSPPAFC